MRVCQDQERLIEAVKKRPLLYSRYHPQFQDRKLKLGFWYEVCEEVVPGFKDFTCGKKGETVCEIQRRWKTLRDGFSRELQFQKQDRMKRAKGEYVRRRKIYGYYHHLRFLLKQKKKQAEDETVDEENNEEDEQSESDHTEASNSRDEEPISQPFKTEPGTSFYIDVVEESKVAEPNKFVDNERVAENDEDKLFCLSLVSSFKKMTEKQKYEARIGIMQVLSEVRFRNSESDPILP